MRGPRDRRKPLQSEAAMRSGLGGTGRTRGANSDRATGSSFMAGRELDRWFDVAVRPDHGFARAGTIRTTRATGAHSLRPHHKWKWPVQTFRPRSGTSATTTPRHRHPRDETSASPRSAGACVAAAGAWSGTAASRCFFVHHAGARGSPAFAGRGAPTGTAGAGRDPAAAGAVRPSHAHGRRVSAHSGGLAAQRRPPRPTSSCGSRQAGGRRVATAGPVSEWKFSCVGVQLITNSRW